MANKSDSKPKVGLEQNRKCRDIIFLLIFILFWAGMFIVAQAAIASGDIRQLTFDELT